MNKLKPKSQTRGALLSLVSDFFKPLLLKPLIELNSAPRPGSFDLGGACFCADAEGATGGAGGGGAADAAACFLFCTGAAVTKHNKTIMQVS